MQEAPTLLSDAERISALNRMNLLSMPAEADIDRIVQFAGEYFGTPIALFSLIDHDRQWFKSRFGLDVPETPRNISFCGHAIAQEEAFVVDDAAKDSRFSDNPLVTGGPKVGFYAGMPIKAPDGQNVGTLCIIDQAPRHFSDHDRERLRDFAWWLQLALDKRVLSESQQELVVELDQAKRESMLDPMTQTWNRRGFAELAKREIAKARRANKPLALIMIDIDHFKRINDTFGHPEGDKTIITLARLLRSGSRTTDVLARLGGEEFAILMPEIGRDDALRLSESLRQMVEVGSNINGGKGFTISVGVKWVELLNADVNEDVLVALADKALYEAKQSGRNRVVESQEAA